MKIHINNLTILIYCTPQIVLLAIDLHIELVDEEGVTVAEITEAGFTVRGDYTATREGYVRIDIYAGDERVFTEALGPAGG